MAPFSISPCNEASTTSAADEVASMRWGIVTPMTVVLSHLNEMNLMAERTFNSLLVSGVLIISLLYLKDGYEGAYAVHKVRIL